MTVNSPPPNDAACIVLYEIVCADMAQFLGHSLEELSPAPALPAHAATGTAGTADAGVSFAPRFREVVGVVGGMGPAASNLLMDMILQTQLDAGCVIDQDYIPVVKIRCAALHAALHRACSWPRRARTSAGLEEYWCPAPSHGID